ISTLTSPPPVDALTQTISSVAASIDAGVHAADPLPAIDDVTVKIVQIDGSWSPPPASTSGGGRTWAWSPPTPQRIERDREVGRRGEELVYRQELERVHAAGHPAPERVVVWTSNID